MMARVDTGVLCKPEDTVQRLTPNKKGNRPTATIAWLPTVDNGMIHLRFGKNIRETSAALYGLVWVDDDNGDSEDGQ